MGLRPRLSSVTLFSQRIQQIMSSSPSHQPITVPSSPNITTTSTQQQPDHQHVATHKTIGMLGGVALLINNVTGGGLVLFPGLFHEAGWLPMTASIIGVALLSSLCGLMLLESMAMMPQNGNFQKRIEYCNIAEYYMSRRVYVITGILYQASLLTAIIKDDITPFGPIYLISLGFWLTALFVIPLSLADLDDNVLVQKGALISMVVILITWIIMFIVQGLDMTRVPMLGTSQDSVLGVVVFNFAIITSLPSWVNEKQERVSVLKTIGIAFPASSIIYLVIGALGGMAFTPWYASDNPNQTLLDQIYELDTRIARLTFYLFPVCVNLTSIPVFCIMSRYNLIESGVCTRRTANLIAVFAPWIISIPLYTGSGYENLINWSGIVINSYVNFVVPPIIYILAIRRTSTTSHSSSHPISSPSTLQVLLTEADDRHIMIPDKLKKTIHVKHIASASQDGDEPISPWKCYDTSCIGMIWYIITLPWRLFFYFTIPDTRRSAHPSTWLLLLTTIMITCWMSVLTWHIIWMSTEISDVLRIPTMILGIIVLATGIRLPSLWRSVMWARAGDIKTPISLSHHVFDLCIGIGVPVILFGAIHGTPFSHFSSTTPIISLTTFLLIGSTLILLQGWTTWQFQPRLIIWLIPAYVAFMLWIILIIQDKFGDVTGGLLVKPC